MQVGAGGELTWATVALPLGVVSKQPERGCRLIWPQPGDVDQLDHRAVSFWQQRQLGEQVPGCLFGVDPVEQLRDLVLVEVAPAGRRWILCCCWR